MPAMLDDPTSPVIYRATGGGPYPTANNPQIPSSIFPRPVTLRDRVTIATLIPFFSPSQVPGHLLSYLCDSLNKEIEGGDTYPMINPLLLETFGPYWFGNFAAVMVLGDIGGIEAVQEMENNGTEWNKVCLGSFYVKPNYPGRSSHVCNGGFLVTPAARNKGVGKSMGECYLDWAPQLGYTYSVFNLVYESNTASTRIWDSLGFKRIGRVPACGNLRSSTALVDAIIYGRDLAAESEEFLSEERFDKIRYYLKHAKYPTGADRAEKSRLRSAATHYKLVGGQIGEPERLMLKDKEVISEPQSQYEIARSVHLQAHGGINKTTAIIATKYHWVRIKETVSQVIKNCMKCKESAKVPTAHADGTGGLLEKTKEEPTIVNMPQARPLTADSRYAAHGTQMLNDHTFNSKRDPFAEHESQSLHGTVSDLEDYSSIAIDPQIMEQLQSQIESGFQHPEDAYGQTTLPHFSDTSQMHHHTHGNDYHVGETDQLMSGAAAAGLDHQHSIDLVEGTHLDGGRIHQHLLQDAFMDSDGNPHFKQ